MDKVMNKVKDYTIIVRGGINVVCRVLIEKEKNVIHVFDPDSYDAMSVTNGIDLIQPEILRLNDLPGKVEDYTWYLYGTDGIASEYKNKTFSFVPLESPVLVDEFVRIMKDKLLQ